MYALLTLQLLGTIKINEAQPRISRRGSNTQYIILAKTGRWRLC